MTTKKEESNVDKIFDENQQHKLQKESSVLTKAIEQYTERMNLQKSQSNQK